MEAIDIEKIEQLSLKHVQSILNAEEIDYILKHFETWEAFEQFAETLLNSKETLAAKAAVDFSLLDAEIEKKLQEKPIIKIKAIPSLLKWAAVFVFGMLCFLLGQSTKTLQTKYITETKTDTLYQAKYLTQFDTITKERIKKEILIKPETLFLEKENTLAIATQAADETKSDSLPKNLKNNERLMVFLGQN